MLKTGFVILGIIAVIFAVPAIVISLAQPKIERRLAENHKKYYEEENKE